MAFPVNGILDAFNRANGALGGNWAALGIAGTAPTIVSNAVSNGGAGNYRGAYLTTPSYGADAECYIETGSGALEYYGVLARLVGAGSSSTTDGYQVGHDNNGDNIEFTRRDDGVGTRLGALFSQTLINGDALGIFCNGTTIEGYHRRTGTWTQVATRTDSTYSAAGNVGFDMYDGGTGDTLDNFGGGTVSAGGTEIFGAASVDLIFGIVTAAKKNAKGAAELPLVLNIATAAKKTAYGASVTPIVFTIATAGTVVGAAVRLFRTLMGVGK